MLRAEIDRLRERLGGPPLEWQYALRDVSLFAEPGESIGLVGDNGSGKSTLLKIICGVMDPYAGRVEVNGRLGALIEVRAGIQPELSGRENIKLYGTLLGLPRVEVMKRFDQIVEFAQLETAIDRQVKFYSSGMQMRLGFSVAAFLEPAILLVDEVLAVGDAAFQQRCLERMRYVLEQGTTVVYVSHDLASVGAVCKRALWLHNGVLMGSGTVRDILNAYRRSVESTPNVDVSAGTGPVQLRGIEVTNPEAAVPCTAQPLEIRAIVDVAEERRLALFFGISEGTADPILVVRRRGRWRAGSHDVRCTFPELPLPRGRYALWVGVFDHSQGNEEIINWQRVDQFEVFGPDLDDPPTAVVRRAPFYVEHSWEVELADQRTTHTVAYESTSHAGR